ncbi:MAG: hypothetical protein ACO1SV_18480 [Fimbriimonas sp.]
MGDAALREIRFDPAQLKHPEQAWWATFQTRALSETERAVAAWEDWYFDWQSGGNPAEFTYAFNADVWKELKKWLFKHVFFGKCAYCESPLELDRYMGDAEHVRPKGRVTRKDAHAKRRRAVVRFSDGRELDHPGYFWLAYDWRNLIPACSACNSGDAKVDQFPTEDGCLLAVQLQPDEVAGLSEAPIGSVKFPGYYYLFPHDLDLRERPLLLNPLNPVDQRHPRKHLRFGVGGTVVAIDGSDIGKHTIQVLKLDRDVLCRRRQKEQERIRALYYSEVSNPKPDVTKRLKKALAKYLSGEEEYSAAALDYLDVVQEIQARATKEALREAR